MSIAATADVLFRRQGVLGRITLNRPKALNALTLDMVDAIAGQLSRWAEDDTVHAVVLDGAGPRGLCAGGDIRALHASGLAGDGMANQFWTREYELNAMIAGYPKPYVALMDGLVMGGGVGVSAHARHRIVTERTTLAMPEVTIGFLPDVGGTWLLSRAPGMTGTYLGLTGTSIGGWDAVHAGFADVVVPSGSMDAVITCLASTDLSGNSEDAVSALIRDFAAPAETAPLLKKQPVIDRIFAGSSVEAILQAAWVDADPWGAEQARIMERNSPTSLKITLAAIQRAREIGSLRGCLDMERHIGLKILEGCDFYEGVRAQVLDKDRSPKWSPDTLKAVSTETVAAYFPPSP